jgi:hypothetical protein
LQQENPDLTKTKTLMLLAATAVLTTGVGLPAWSTLHAAGPAGMLAPLTALPGSDGQRPLVLADSGEHEDESAGTVRRESDDDEGECDDEDGACGASAPPTPAPAGSVAPPQNGLFDNSTAPQATVK